MSESGLKIEDTNVSCCKITPQLGLTRSQALQRMSATHNVTELLALWAKGDVRKRFMNSRRLSIRNCASLPPVYLRKERQGHTLQPTALVNEAYLRLVDQKSPNWQDRAHFFGVAARLMRQYLAVDHARRDGRQSGRL